MQTSPSISWPTEQTRPNKPAHPGAFTSLRSGQIEPQGWLRDWALIAKNGLTGHLDKIVPEEWAKVVTLGWSGEDAYPCSLEASKLERWPSLYQGEGWQTEQSAYWYDGLVRLGLALHDEELLNKARAFFDPIIQNTKADGNNFLHWVDAGEFGPHKDGFSFEQWGCAVLGRAMVAYYAGTGEPEVLACIERAYTPNKARYHFDTVSRNGVNNEVMLEAWELGGADFLKERVLSSGYVEHAIETAHAWAAGDIKPDHGVSFNELSKQPAILYPYVGEEVLVSGSANRFVWADQHYTLPHGGIDSDEHMGGVNAFSGTETCNITDGLCSNAKIGMVAGDRIFWDRMEQLFFNCGPSTVTRDCCKHVYFQLPNRIDSGNGSISSGLERWFDYAKVQKPFCCTANQTRQLPAYIEHMWAGYYTDRVR